MAWTVLVFCRDARDGMCDCPNRFVVTPDGLTEEAVGLGPGWPPAGAYPFDDRDAAEEAGYTAVGDVTPWDIELLEVPDEDVVQLDG
jgi:hypothetical protein